MIVLLLAGIYLLARRRLGRERRLRRRRLPRDHRPLRPPARLLPAQVRKAKELAERDLKAGDTLSDEFEAVAQRIGRVGALAGLIVVVTIFFMTYKPFLTALTARAPARPSLPVAMFDSGVGGLTVLHECLVSLPEEDFVYLGDTACSPTGHATPTRCASGSRAIAELLLGGGAKLLVIACNTATSIGEDVAREVAARARGGGRAGGRAAGRDRRGDHRQRPGRRAGDAEHGRERRLPPRARRRRAAPLEVTEVEAPDLAPFIQDGSPFDEGVMEMARAYCAPLKRAEVDTLILGCTHYPLVAPMLQRILGRDVRLVSGGHAVAAAVQRTLERAGLARERRRRGRLPLPLHRRRRVLPRARHPLPADAARRGRAGRRACRGRAPLPLGAIRAFSSRSRRTCARR